MRNMLTALGCTALVLVASALPTAAEQLQANAITVARGLSVDPPPPPPPPPPRPCPDNSPACPAD